MKNLLYALLILLSVRPVYSQLPEKFQAPTYRNEQIIVSHLDQSEKPYLAFPTLLRLNNHEVLITYKRGMSHGGDQEADAEALLFNTENNQVKERQTIGNLKNQIFQLTLATRFPNGHIYYFADMQNRGWDGRNYRSSMRFTDGNKEGFQMKGWMELPLANGREFSYPFDIIYEGSKIYMLAMSFGYRPGNSWSVSVLESHDEGQSWNLKADLTKILGNGAFNESSFLKDGKDFVVVLRGYGNQATTLARFDNNFTLLKKVELTGENKLLPNYIGWPRIFQKENNLYIIGRIWNKSAIPSKKYEMQNSSLGLLRINKKSFDVENISLLDNPQVESVLKDGYYAGFYWQPKLNESFFNVITYRAFSGAEAPDIIRLEYKWNEVK
ncbi:hypothetical protein [Sphingobacterium hotanense]|uniref:hypothetical protein n=1 Tax=Sphingobacterium hotanense TaxID=649196 RepID=UPI0021A2C026|nr:hypothetical protein [Sphingobacterium hotanense]MCT1526045.1 hypothetical protein [Sphingobacterium hotanense]